MALYSPTASNAKPVKGGEFGADRGPNYKSGPRYHRGKDVPVPVGTPLYGSGDGVVAAVSTTNTGSAGWFVNVVYGSVRVETYHMSRVDVRAGQRVNVYTRLGLSGGKKAAPGAGSSNGPHVHIEVHVNGKLANPDDYLNPRSAISGGDASPIPLEDDMAASPWILYRYTSAEPNLWIWVNLAEKTYRVVPAAGEEAAAIEQFYTDPDRRLIADPVWGATYGNGQYRDLNQSTPSGQVDAAALAAALAPLIDTVTETELKAALESLDITIGGK